MYAKEAVVHDHHIVKLFSLNVTHCDASVLGQGITAYVREAAPFIFVNTCANIIQLHSTYNEQGNEAEGALT
jgi:hypothetical protein